LSSTTYFAIANDPYLFPEHRDPSSLSQGRMLTMYHLIECISSIDDIKVALAYHTEESGMSICRHSGNVGGPDTMNAIIIDPYNSVLLYSPESPCKGNWENYRLGYNEF
jgi:hypothetical protein